MTIASWVWGRSIIYTPTRGVLWPPDPHELDGWEDSKFMGSHNGLAKAPNFQAQNPRNPFLYSQNRWHLLPKRRGSFFTDSKSFFFNFQALATKKTIWDPILNVWKSDFGLGQQPSCLGPQVHTSCQRCGSKVQMTWRSGETW